jgi:hypothetical protein
MANPFNILISQLLKAYKLDGSANKQDNKVVLSTRQWLRELNAVEIFKLVEVFTERADSLQHWLNSDSGTPQKYTSESDFIAKQSQVREVGTL